MAIRTNTTSSFTGSLRGIFSTERNYATLRFILLTTAVSSVILIALYITSLYSYLLFHSLIELFTIIVASGIFVIAWNARAYLNNNYLLFLGIASIFIALLDLVHTLVYKGMGVLGGESANPATQLWIAARYVQSLSLLIAPFFLGRRLRIPILIAGYTMVTVFLLGSILAWNIFPTAYMDDGGLTTFKKVSEYVISILLIISIILLIRKHQEFDTNILHFLILFLIFTVGSEIAFTSYISVYGEANLIGHFLRLIAFYFLYKAIIETGLVKPFSLLLRNSKILEDQLREYADSLQVSNLELDAYAHTVAHDLKNPLTVIASTSDLILHIPDMTRRELKDYLKQIRTVAFEMDEIIDNLLLLSEVRTVDVLVKPVDMAKIVKNVRHRLSYMSKEVHAHITAPETWPVANGYAPWIEEIWINYLSNAFKYGGRPPGIELGATRQTNGMIRFWIRDNGPGVAAGSQDTLFVPFTQLRHAHQSGHGLGLSIVLHIVEKLGGQVGVESKAGKGSLFYFTLPAAQTARSNRR